MATAPPTVPPSVVPSAPPEPIALARSYEAADPVDLARRLVGAERVIRSASTDAAPLVEAGRLQQAAYRQLVTHPDWVTPVLEHVPSELHSAVRANVEAGTELRALTQPRDRFPDWNIVAPPPATQLRGYYAEAETEFRIKWYHLAAIHLVETRMGRIRGTSTAGARGPMQFLPSTWARWGHGDIEDARDSILAAARFLRGHGAPANVRGALFAYNPSARYVRAVTLYAEQMRAHPRAYLGYYHWQVYYRTTEGDALLEVGWAP
jgi:soluble lytic murein transglycosylase-like protein